MGLAHAGAGNKREAIEAGQKAISILPLSKDAFYGVSPLLEMALIYDMLGETDLAMDHLEMVLSIPNYYTVEYLKRDVRYKNIRKNKRYEDLITRYKPVIDFKKL
jgi:tetratricopeptide (TPR) repeat protein